MVSRKTVSLPHLEVGTHLCKSQRCGRNTVSLAAQAARALPCNEFAFAEFSNLPLGFGHENSPKRGLAADTLQFIGRVPKACSIRDSGKVPSSS